MKTRSRLFVLSVTLAALGLVVPLAWAGPGAQSKDAKVDVTGEWVFQVDTAVGSGSPTFTFKQEGEKLTGHYKGAFGEADLKGTVKGNAISFSFDADAGGTPITITYTGTVEKDTVKGTVKLGDLGDGTFSGKRTK